MTVRLDGEAVERLLFGQGAHDATTASTSPIEGAGPSEVELLTEIRDELRKR